MISSHLYNTCGPEPTPGAGSGTHSKDAYIAYIAVEADDGKV